MKDSQTTYQNNENEEKRVQNGQEEVGQSMHVAYVFVPEGIHKWIQRGPYIVCMRCEIQHAIWVGMERKMIGERVDSTPILVERKSKV